MLFDDTAHILNTCIHTCKVYTYTVYIIIFSNLTKIDAQIVIFIAIHAITMY